MRTHEGDHEEARPGRTDTETRPGRTDTETGKGKDPYAEFEDPGIGRLDDGTPDNSDPSANTTGTSSGSGGSP